MKLSLIDRLDENRLLRARGAGNFTAKDMAELAFVYLIALHIMRSEYETAPFARTYARRTMSHGNFEHADPNNTDLYQFLNVLKDHDGNTGSHLKHPEANELFWHEVHFNGSTAKQLLNQMSQMNYDGRAAKRLLLQLEQQLHITNSNYRSVRRLGGDWDIGNLDTEQKKLTVTRLLQALRAKARLGDIIQQFQHLADKNSYELTNVHDPETGSSPHPVALPTAAVNKSGGMSFMKGLAIAAGIAAANHIISKVRL
jgi:hypothetical protein